MPSNPYCLINVLLCCTKCALLAAVAIMAVASSMPMVHPPTASNVFMLGLEVLRALRRPYLQQITYMQIKLCSIHLTLTSDLTSESFIRQIPLFTIKQYTCTNE